MRLQSNDPAAIVQKATWILLAVALNALEFFFPRIPLFPWLKPGLANCMTLIWLIEFGLVDTILFFLLRIWIAGFYFGFSFFTLSLSMTGGALATLAMGLCWITMGKRGLMGSVGMSITGALFHNLGQIIAVYFLMARNGRLFYQLPLMFIASIVFGAVVGLLTPPLLKFLKKSRFSITEKTLPRVSADITVKRSDALISLALLAGSFGLLFINDMRVLLLCSLAAAVAVMAVSHGSWGLLARPLRKFWLLFAFVACLHLTLSYGTRIEFLPFVTREGVFITIEQWLRLWIWLELSLILMHFKFHDVVFSALRRFFPNHRPTLCAGLLALEFFPSTVAVVQARARRNLRTFLRHPLTGSKKAAERIYGDIADVFLVRQPAADTPTGKG